MFNSSNYTQIIKALKNAAFSVFNGCNKFLTLYMVADIIAILSGKNIEEDIICAESDIRISISLGIGILVALLTGYSYKQQTENQYQQRVRRHKVDEISSLISSLPVNPESPALITRTRSDQRLPLLFHENGSRNKKLLSLYFASCIDACDMPMTLFGMVEFIMALSGRSVNEEYSNSKMVVRIPVITTYLLTVYILFIHNYYKNKNVCIEENLEKAVFNELRIARISKKIPVDTVEFMYDWKSAMRNYITALMDSVENFMIIYYFVEFTCASFGEDIEDRIDQLPQASKIAVGTSFSIAIITAALCLYKKDYSEKIEEFNAQKDLRAITTSLNLENRAASASIV